MLRSELRRRTQELRGAVGGADSLSAFFGPSDLIELLDDLDSLEYQMSELKYDLQGAERRIADLCDDVEWLESRIGVIGG